MKVPNLGEAHCGEGAEQSTQVAFPGLFWRSASCTDGFSIQLCGVLARFEEHIYLALGFRVDLPHLGYFEQQSTSKRAYYILLVIILPNHW